MTVPDLIDERDDPWWLSDMPSRPHAEISVGTIHYHYLDIEEATVLCLKEHQLAITINPCASQEQTNAGAV
jgi:hypothetical protein